MKVKNCKLKTALICEETENIEKIAKRMKDHREKYILVMSKKNRNKILGVISVTDLVYKVIAAAKDPKRTIAREIMVSPAYTVNFEDSVAKAYFAMVAKNIFYCPVLDKGKLVGVLMLNEAFNHMVRTAKTKIKEK